jgi:hypothetical protein
VSKVNASVGTAGDAFGRAVSMDGSTAIVGAPFGSPAIDPSGGAAYVFVQSGATWTQQQELGLPAGGGSDEVGWAVSVSGNTAVVGAPGVDTALAFARSGSSWALQQRLSGGGNFGQSVAVFGPWALVGSSSTNAAFVFQQTGSTWSQAAQLAPTGGGASDAFGWSSAIAMLGGTPTALVGADNATASGGAAYTFAPTASAVPTLGARAAWLALLLLAAGAALASLNPRAARSRDAVLGRTLRTRLGLPGPCDRPV